MTTAGTELFKLIDGNVSVLCSPLIIDVITVLLGHTDQVQHPLTLSLFCRFSI